MLSKVCWPFVLLFVDYKVQFFEDRLRLLPGVKFSSTFLFLLFKSIFSDNLPSNHPIAEKKNEIKFTLDTFISELNNNWWTRPGSKYCRYGIVDRVDTFTIINCALKYLPRVVTQSQCPSTGQRALRPITLFKVIGNVSKDVFARRTSTGSGLFSAFLSSVSAPVFGLIISIQSRDT